jgi:hypothetical protein
VIALLLACGFAPNTREVPAPAADGLGPYRDEGPIEICEGPVRLVPPDAAGADDAGVCVASDAPPPRSCVSDGACGPRERCVCGRCSVPRCRSTADCTLGSTCDLVTRICSRTCFEDADCGPSESCRPEGCQTRCGSDGDCARGEVCSRASGLCIVQRCDAVLVCGAGRACDAMERFADLHEPDAVRADGRIELYVEARASGGAVVLRVVSDDGRSFEVDPADPVLLDARAPSVVLSGRSRVLFYERADGTIGRAEGDGATFEPIPDAVGEGHTPSAADLLTIAYEDDAGIEVARGASPVAGPFGPSFWEDPKLFRDVGDVGSPEILRRETALGEGLFVLYAQATGVETSDLVLGDEARAAPRTASIVAALAADDLDFAPYPFGPVFARVVNVTDYRSETEPSVVFVGSEAFLYYVDPQEGVSLARQGAAGP